MKTRQDYEPLFTILYGLHLESKCRYWIERRDDKGNICDIEVDIGQMSAVVEILLPMSHNALTTAEEYIK